MKKILILFAHPALHKSRIHSRLARAAGEVEGVTFCNLYDRYPDFFIHVPYEQKQLRDHDVLIWQHPFYWYSCPALLKEWMDLVLEHNFAYGRKGTNLHGKKALSVISTGGSEAVYTRQGFSHYSVKQFLAPFHQTARLCGMEYLPPLWSTVPTSSGKRRSTGTPTGMPGCLQPFATTPCPLSNGRMRNPLILSSPNKPVCITRISSYRR